MTFCTSDYAWADNTQQMDPCEVASLLMNQCDSIIPPLKPIHPGDTYPGPTQLSCMCSSVIYALVSACSDCQGGRIESWPTWSTNCVTPSIDSFEGSLANISVPAWAYFDVKSNPTYSRSAASSSAVASQTIPTIASASAAAAAVVQTLPTTTNTFQTTPTDTSTLAKSGSTSLATASFGSDLSSTTTTGNRTAAIAGGTIAGAVFLAMSTALAYWYMRRRRRRTRVPPSVAYMAVHGLDPSGLGSKEWLTSRLNNGTDNLL